MPNLANQSRPAQLTCMLPLMLPMAQHSVLRPFQVQVPPICPRSFSNIYKWQVQHHHQQQG